MDLKSEEDIEKELGESLLEWIRIGDIQEVTQCLEKGGNINYINADGYMPLHFAAKYNQKQILLELLKRGSELDYPANNGQTALHIACGSRSTDVALLLVDRVANVNLADHEGQTALHKACISGFTDVALLFIDKGVDINKTDIYGFTPLHVAARYNQVEILVALIERGLNLYRTCYLGRTALHKTGEYGSTDVASLLIDRGADINMLDEFGETALHLAINKGNTEVAILLIEKGADLSLRNCAQKQPLRIAIEHRNTDIALALIDKGANLSNELGYSTLSIAVQYNHVEIFLELLKRGLEFCDECGYTALHVASEHSSTDVALLLIDRGADINLADDFGRTALHIAIQSGSTDIALLLIDRGADLTLTDDSGHTPLHKAIKYNEEEICIELLNRGSKLGEIGENGQTALHKASKYGSTEVALLLIDRGADLNLTDKCKVTALHLASEFNHTDVALLLIDRGAKLNLTDDLGRTPLHIAIQFKSKEIASILIDRGSSMNMQDKTERTPLHIAVQFESNNIAKQLIDGGANLNLKKKTGNIPLHLVVQCKYDYHSVDVVEELIKGGSDVNMTNNQGNIPLHLVVQCKHDYHSVLVVQILIKGGSDVNMTNNQGELPLHLALECQADTYTVTIIHELIQAGSDVKRMTKQGDLPLHLAVRCVPDYESINVVQTLINGGADVNMMSKQGELPLHLVVQFKTTNNSIQVVRELIKGGADVNMMNKNKKTALDIADSKMKKKIQEQLYKGNQEFLWQNLRGIENETVSDLQQLLHDSSHACYWNRVYLVGPYSVGKSCLAKILVGEILPVTRQSTDGIWIYMGRAGMNVDKMEWIFYPKGNAITEILTSMLMSIKASESKNLLDAKRSISSDKKEAPTKLIRTMHEEPYGSTNISEISHDEPNKSKSVLKNDLNIKKLPVDEKSSCKQGSVSNSEHKELHHNKASEDFDHKTLTTDANVLSKKETEQSGAVTQSHVTEKSSSVKKQVKGEPSHNNEEHHSQFDKSARTKAKESKTCSPTVFSENTSTGKDFRTPIKQKQPAIQQLAQISRKKTNLTSVIDITESDLIEEIKSDMSEDKIHQLILKAVQEGKYTERVVPIDIWDFGGQKDYYMTHQLFITSRGIFVLMFNGNIGLRKHMADLSFLPGHFGKPTVAVYLLHWVNSILTYCKRTDDGFPRIIFVATHKDEKWFERTREATRKQLEDELQILFKSHAGLKHLEFKPLIFVNAINPEDPEIGDLRKKLMQRATEHPRWGEAMPTRWIPLELQLAQKSAEGVNIISRKQLLALNSRNESMILTETQLETFLKVQHSLGKLLYFDVENLRDFIIISPSYLVEVLRSLVTEKQFWPKGHRFSRILRYIQEFGMIEADDIYYLWDQETFKHILPYKEYMIQMLVHLDVLVAPRTRFEEVNSPTNDVSRFLIPCMITKENDTMFLKRFWQANTSIILSYTFVEEVIPPALSYRFLSSFITSWDIKNFKDRNTEKRMLFSDLAVVKVDNSHDVAVQVKTNRLIVSLIHAKKKEEIFPTLASSLQECMTAAIVRISEFYSMLAEETKPNDVNSGIPFSIEFGVFCKEDLCFFNHNEVSLSCDEPLWFCKIHKQRHETKCLTAWFSEKEPREICTINCQGLGKLEKDQCPLPHHIRRLAEQLSLDECRNIAIMLGSSTQEWNALEYQFQHQPPNDLKFTALWSGTIKSDTFSFESLQRVLKTNELSDHILCQVFRDVVLDVPDMSEEVLNKLPSVDALLDLSNHIGNSSMQLAIELEIDVSYIQQIQHDHKNKLLEQTRKCFLKWRQSKFPKPTILRLLKALYRIGKFGQTYKVLKCYLE